eukprot:GHVR01141619.1.p1 GENE.GHVR01141619.1~~GHVR01141619.1.p1  ORF type:complete len:423 (-),score=81.07 GHVR01141619.1:471-1739(-)
MAAKRRHDNTQKACTRQTRSRDKEALLEEFVKLGEEANEALERNDEAKAARLFVDAVRVGKAIVGMSAEKQKSLEDVLLVFEGKLSSLRCPGSAFLTSRRGSTGASTGASASTCPPSKVCKKSTLKLDEMEQRVMDESFETTDNAVSWNDVVGMESAKQALYESVVLPSLNPHLFSNLRAPPKGILLFGPPGNGKTYIAKATAAQCKASFFSISASTLTSKWHGEGEKLVKALFSVARKAQPSVIFVDELDSLLSARSANENDVTRRMKTEFMVAFEGASTSTDDRVVVLGATNRPMDLDDAVIRRFPKRILIPLPDTGTRESIITRLFVQAKHSLSPSQIGDIARKTKDYSASDLTALCREAALGPVRELDLDKVEQMSEECIPRISNTHLEKAMGVVRPSASQELVRQLYEWNTKYGCAI